MLYFGNIGPALCNQGSLESYRAMTENKGELSEVASVAKRRPARVQVDPTTISADGKPAQTGEVFNIWYSKWTGGERNGRALLTHSKTRCNVKQDSGYTRADKYVSPDSINRTNFICLYFARGSCCNGKTCEYLHRLPNDLDIFPTTKDCFGRDKFSSYRDDMAGVGNFNDINRTLYVARFNSMEGNIELQVNRNFGEFGEIERVRVVKDKSIAFITYKLESQAQFAKEAMYGQSLRKSDENEALNIRWANQDPDPKARKRKQAELEAASLEKAKILLDKLEEQEAKKQKVVVEEVDEEEIKEENIMSSRPKAFAPAPLLQNINISRLHKIAARKPSTDSKHESSLSSAPLLSGYESSDDEE